jgi:hypothetical protein
VSALAGALVNVWLCFAEALRSKTQLVDQQAAMNPKALRPCFAEPKHSHTKPARGA